MESDEVLSTLEYTNENKDKVKLINGNVGLLKVFKQCVADQTNQGHMIEEDDWIKITKKDFNAFRVRYANRTTINSIATPSAQFSSVRPSSVVDSVRDFKRGIKRDATQFSILKDDANWDNWNRSTTAQARAQDIADVLDPTYAPPSPDDIALFVEKQKFMYAVFEKTLQTDKGKALVRHYQETFDAQAIYRELSAYAMQSTKATMNASNLLSYITTTMLGDGKWKGTTHAFILHWQDQVRKYHDLSPQNTLSQDLQCTLLQNAVHPIMELRQVKLQAAQFKTHTGKDLSYDEYCSLLLSAAQQYDTQIGHSSNKIVKRRIYEHDLYFH